MRAFGHLGQAVPEVCGITITWANKKFLSTYASLNEVHTQRLGENFRGLVSSYFTCQLVAINLLLGKLSPGSTSLSMRHVGLEEAREREWNGRKWVLRSWTEIKKHPPMLCLLGKRKTFTWGKEVIVIWELKHYKEAKYVLKHKLTHTHIQSVWMSGKETHWSYWFYTLAKMEIVYTISSSYFGKTKKFLPDDQN